MGSGNRLSGFERGRIVEMAKSGKTQTEIAREINRSQTVISHFLRSPQAYGNKNPGGRPKKITKKTERRIGRVLARNRFSTAADLVSATDAPVHPRTMRNYLRDKGLCFLSLRKAPFLTPAHKEKRLEFARKMAGFVEGW
jgi:transposase